MKFLFKEMSLDSMKVGTASGITQKALTDRFKNGDSHIELFSAICNIQKDFLEIIFQGNLTYGTTDYIAASDVQHDVNGAYSVVLRSYQVSKFLKQDFYKLTYSQEMPLIKQVIHNCDVKFYSDDPSYYFQGSWEDGEKAGIAIYKYTGEPGKNIWHDKMVNSGGLQNPNIHLTKHIAQIVEQIDSYLPKICQNLKIN